MSRRKILLVALIWIGLFLIGVGGDSLKIGHLEYFPTLSPSIFISFTYHAISIGLLILGLVLVLVAAEICRRFDKRASAALPGIRHVPSLCLFCFPQPCSLSLLGRFLIHA